MYRTIISLKKNIVQEKLAELTNIIISTFDNRAGKVTNNSLDPYKFVFEGEGEPVFECLDLGVATLARTDFINNVDEWKWIDEEDSFENCDILELYRTRVTKYGK